MVLLESIVVSMRGGRCVDRDRLCTSKTVCDDASEVKWGVNRSVPLAVLKLPRLLGFEAPKNY